MPGIASTPARGFDPARYKAYLLEIGYLAPEKDAFRSRYRRRRPGDRAYRGPQLVVPVSNARYALNAANARWGSLYDALYGTDVIPEDGAPRTGAYNARRGAQVIAFARDFLDEHFALAEGSHRDAVAYRCSAQGLEIRLKNGGATRLNDPAAFRGFQGERSDPRRAVAGASWTARGDPHRSPAPHRPR